jgi:5-methylcytosine-specific restriction endonuclease McrA
MNRPLKRPRLRLDPESYRRLHQRVLDRDGWRCQSCGRSRDLQVHHIEPRSRLGNDTEENLITLCAACHRSCHAADPKLGAPEAPGTGSLR